MYLYFWENEKLAEVCVGGIKFSSNCHLAAETSTAALSHLSSSNCFLAARKSKILNLKIKKGNLPDPNCILAAKKLKDLHKSKL